jgi:hypothetical protein
VRKLLLAVAITSLASSAALAAEGEDINRIVDIAYNHGQVVQTAAYLSDRIGGRLTNSPAMRQAEDWTAQQFRDYGLAEVHKEGFEFGRGWWIEDHRLKMSSPRALALRSIPVAWTPGTSGPVTAPIVVAPMSEEKHFAEWKGKLAGKIVLVSLPGAAKDATDAPFERLDDGAIHKLDSFEAPNNDPAALKSRLKRRGFALKLDAFLKSEGALAWGKISYRGNGLVHGEGSTFQVGRTPALPAVEIAAEDYRRLARLAKLGPVSVTLDSKLHFDDSDTKAYNIIAEIPGSEPGAGYVMAGAHLDSWVAADGAADNAAGSAVVMEAARILATMGVRPKRTIRFALWSGEEQGLHGSFAYVDRHLATRPSSGDREVDEAGPYASSRFAFPISPRPGLRDLKAYFNIDNGGGKIRGLYAEGNFAAVPVLRGWLSPLGSLDANAVVANPTGATDHVGMVRLGLPAFQFIQDPLDYESTAHHSSVDTFDHLRADDLRQAAAVLASVLLSAANSDKVVPPNVLPGKPDDSDPFRYKDPNAD